MNLGYAITSIRKRKKFLQKTLARQAYLSVQSLSKIENGSRNPTPETLEKICKVLDVSKAELWFESLEDKDIAPDKRHTFKLIKPLISDILK